MAVSLVKNDIVELDIIDLSSGGEGVGKLCDFAIFVRNAVVGDRVRAKLIKVTKSYAVGIVDSIISPSPDRITPVCPYFSRCGGCQLMNQTYQSQLDYKQNSIYQTIKKISGLACAVGKVEKSPQQIEYRNKFSLPVRKQGIGFFASNSHRIVPIERCLIQSKRLDQAMRIFREFVSKANLPLYDEQTHSGLVRHVVVRDFADRLIVTVVLKGAAKIDFMPLYQGLKALGEVELWLNYNSQKSNIIFGQQFEHLFGKNSQATISGLSVPSLHPAAFWQVNDQIRQALYQFVLDRVSASKPDMIIDAFSGGGVLTALLSAHAKRTVGIEISSEAVADADILHAKNGAKNIQNICGDCAQVLPPLAAEVSVEFGNIAIVLDPPRKGCQRQVLDAVIGSGAQTVIYISCNPSTLARDMSVLSTAYDFVEIKPFDMFPQTVHVEVVVVCKRRAQ